MSAGRPQFERSAGCLGLALRWPQSRRRRMEMVDLNTLCQGCCPSEGNRSKGTKSLGSLFSPCFFFEYLDGLDMFWQSLVNVGHCLRKTREAHPVLPTRPWKDIRAEICNTLAIFCYTIELKTWEDSQKYGIAKTKALKDTELPKKPKIEEPKNDAPWNMVK